MLLSAESINRYSPYEVKQIDDLSVRFITQSGVKYMVGVTPDSFIFDENGYNLYIINESETFSKDSLVFETIIAVIRNLFENIPKTALLHICSVEDFRQETRSRLFKMWFERADKDKEYTLQTYDSIDDGQNYFYGLILRKDNPDHDHLIDVFFDFISDY